MKRKPTPYVLSLLLFSASLSAATTWNGNVDSDIVNAANWSNGLPTTSNEGIIDGNYTAEMLGRDDLDDANYVVSNGGTIHCADDISSFRWDDGTITLQSGGSLIIDYTGISSIGHVGTEFGKTTLNLYSGSTGYFAGGLAVGRYQQGFVNQYGGTLTIDGTMYVAANAASSVAGSIFNLYGGSVTAGDYDAKHFNDPDNLNHFNFGAGSSGSLTITQSVYDFQSLVGSGDIRVNNQVIDESDFDNYFKVTNGVDSTTLSLIPETSAFALIAGFAAFGFMVFLRRR